MTSLSLVQSLCARARELVSNGHTLPEKRALHLSAALATARIDTLADRVASLEARHREVNAFYVKTCLQALKEHIDWRDGQMVEKFKGLELGLTALHTELANYKEGLSVWGRTVESTVERIDRNLTAAIDRVDEKIGKVEVGLEEIAKDTDDLHANIDSRLANHESNVTSAIHAAEVSTSELAQFRAAVNRVLRIDHA